MKIRFLECVPSRQHVQREYCFKYIAINWLLLLDQLFTNGLRNFCSKLSHSTLSDLLHRYLQYWKWVTEIKQSAVILILTSHVIRELNKFPEIASNLTVEDDKGMQ